MEEKQWERSADGDSCLIQFSCQRGFVVEARPSRSNQSNSFRLQQRVVSGAIPGDLNGYLGDLSALT